MKSSQLFRHIARVGIIGVYCLVCWDVLPALAAGEETGAGWRPTYDAVMMCINFIILVLILYKLLKNPLKNFFNDQRQAITDEISQLEQQKKKTEAELNEVEAQVTAGDARINTIKQKLAEDGETLKTKIIENAREQSEYMLAAAKKNINNQFHEARKAFRAELIELAMSSAEKKLTKEIDQTDHNKLVDEFLYDLAGNRS